MAMTLDRIGDEVFKELRDTGAGQRRVSEIDTLVRRLNVAADKLRRRRTTLRARPGISFSVNTTQAKHDPLEISVRTHGVDCGVVVLGDAGRMFSPSRNFKQHWSSGRKAADGQVLEWGKHGVAQFIKACRREAGLREYGLRESSIQQWLFRAMEGGGRKKTILRGFQPVLFGGVPIQIPLPVTPRGSREHGRHKGHSDVLARTLPHGRLVVFEVKRPAASRTECEGALDQAVRYAAALDYLMSRDEHRADYWRLFGSRRGQDHSPRFSAVAFLNEAGGASEANLATKLDELLSANSKEYGLSVMFYRQTSNGIEVARVLERTSTLNQNKAAAGRRAGGTRRGTAPIEAAAPRHAKRATLGGRVHDSRGASGRETILEVGAEGGSLSILRVLTPNGAWRFIVLRDETTLADLLDSNDRQGLVFSEESGSVHTFAAALQLIDRYPWHRLMPLTLHEEYAAAVMAEVFRRGGSEETARWSSELSRRFDRSPG